MLTILILCNETYQDHKENIKDVNSEAHYKNCMSPHHNTGQNLSTVLQYLISSSSSSSLGATALCEP
jgi:hypothetical protein